MKAILIVSLLIALNVSAECNLKMAIAAGTYLNELEKAQLTSYQNNSVCEVLSYEFWNCSTAQLKKMKKFFDYKEVLGNYCQPHLAVSENLTWSKDTVMKGLVLYSWKNDYGYFWYALLPGKNGTRKTEELEKVKISEGYFKNILGSLPQGTEVVWNNLVSISDNKQLEFKFPKGKVSDQLNQIATTAKIKLVRSSIHQ